MATQPIDTAKVYALTAAGACSVTLTQGEKSITWEALSEGGQTSFIVPAGATAEISDASALLSPLPTNFKAALGAGNGRTGGAGMHSERGERIFVHSGERSLALNMQHGVWHQIDSATASVPVSPANNGYALQMQLSYIPADTMSPEQTEAWLAGATWLYGAPMMAAGIRYIITLTEAFGEIKANATAWGGAPTA